MQRNKEAVAKTSELSHAEKIQHYTHSIRSGWKTVYPFKKLRAQFDQPQTFDGHCLHKVSFFNKKRKSQVGSKGERIYRDRKWIHINMEKNNLSANAARLAIMMFVSECRIFDIGDKSPKLRVLDNDVISKQILTHGVPGNENDNFEALLIKNNDMYFQGMGRTIFSKFIDNDNDVRFGNFLVDDDSFFIGIDTDRCYWQVMNRYVDKYRQKLTSYSNSHYVSQFEIGTTGQSLYVYNPHQSGFMGEFTVNDYDNLPLLSKHLPFNWDFMFDFYLEYAKKLAKHPSFLNEKHFATLKSLVTMTMKEMLLELHISDSKLKRDMRDTIRETMQRLVKACKQSNAFKSYVKSQGEKAMEAILLEMFFFFEENKHYQIPNKREQKAFWDFITADIIESFTVLQTFLDVCTDKKALQKAEKRLIKSAKNIYKEHFSLKAEAFYNDQTMFYYAKKSHEAMEKAVTTFIKQSTSM